MTPIWKKNKSELKDEDYNNFYMEKFGDYEPPVAHIHSKNEGVATYDALLYILVRLLTITQRTMKRDSSFIQAV